MKYLNSSMFSALLAVLLLIENGNFKTMTRIYNGYTDTLNLYPYVVSIEKLTLDGYLRHCSGVLIEENWVLTAGHCLKRRLNLTVTFGNMSQENSLRRVNVLFVAPHPFMLIDTATINDIGLLKVETIPIKTLAKLSSDNYEESFGLPVVYAGFGITWAEQKLPTAIWKEKVMQLRNSPLILADGVLSKCILLNIVIPRLCVLSKKTSTESPSTMYGDSGGALIHQNTVIAVVSGLSFGLYVDVDSKGHLNIVGERYMVFVPVIHYLNWIQEVIEANKNQAIVYTKLI